MTEQLPFATASWGRRFLALAVDWIASACVAALFFGWGNRGHWVALLIFVLESALGTAFAGGSFGKLLTRLRTVRVAGDPRVDLLPAVARQIMVAVVVPPLIFRPDRRGLHDLAVGTATVTLETYKSRLVAARP